MLRNEFLNSVVVHSASAVPPLSPRSRHRKYSPRVLFNALNTSLRFRVIIQGNENEKKKTKTKLYTIFGRMKPKRNFEQMKRKIYSTHVHNAHTHTHTHSHRCAEGMKETKKTRNDSYIRRTMHDTATASAIHKYACRLLSAFTYSFTTKNGSSKDMTKNERKRNKHALKLDESLGTLRECSVFYRIHKKNPRYPHCISLFNWTTRPSNRILIFVTQSVFAATTTATTTMNSFGGHKKENGQNVYRCGRQTKERKINRHFGLRPQIGRWDFAVTSTEFWFTNFIFMKNFKWKLISHRNSSHISSIWLFRPRMSVHLMSFEHFPFMWSRFPQSRFIYVRRAHTITHGKTYRRLCLSMCLTPNAWKHQLFLVRFVSFPCLNCTNRNQYTRNVMHQYMCPHRTTIFYSVFVFSFSHKEETRESSTHSATTPAYCVSTRRLYNNEWLRLTVDVRTSHHIMPIHIHAAECGQWVRSGDISKCRCVFAVAAAPAAPSTVWWK